MFKGVRLFIRVSLVSVAMITVVSLSHAGSSSPDDTFAAKDIIMVLFGLLQTVFMGIGIWLIANDKELFTRVANVEKKQEVRDTLCDERWDGGGHPMRREKDRRF